MLARRAATTSESTSKPEARYLPCFYPFRFNKLRHVFQRQQGYSDTPTMRLTKTGRHWLRLRRAWFSRSAGGERCVVSTRKGVGVEGTGGSGFSVDITTPVEGITETFSPGVRGVVRDPDTVRSRDWALCLDLGRGADGSTLEAFPWLAPGTCSWG